MLSKRLALCATIAAAIALSACGSDDNNDNVIPGPGNSSNNESNNTDNNTDDNNPTNNASNNVVANNESCSMLEEFTDEGFDIEREFFESSSAEIVSCRGDVGEIATDGAYVLKLQYSTETEVEFKINGIAAGQGQPPRPAAELRRGGCVSGDVVFCDTESRYEAVLDPGVPYFLILNGLLSSGGVDVRVEATPIICTPGEQTCTDGTVETCSGGTTLREWECPADCQGEGCLGDTCEMPLIVAPVVNEGPVVLEGHSRPFTNTWNANGGDGCVLIDGEPAVSSPNLEFFLLVQNVEEGQIVMLDADASSRPYMFFFIEECGATSCLAAFDFDFDNQNRADYRAETSGDVLVAVESIQSDDTRDFNIAVSLRD